AVVNDPALLLADEPTGNLDPALSLDIMNIFREINARGTTVVVATHDPRLIGEVKRRVIFLTWTDVPEVESDAATGAANRAEETSAEAMAARATAARTRSSEPQAQEPVTTVRTDAAATVKKGTHG